MNRTVDSIIEGLQGWVERKEQHLPSEWIEYAMYLTVLLGNETDQLAILEFKVAEILADGVQSEDSVAKARALVEANPLYLEMKRQKAKVKNVEEYIRVAKKMGTIKSTEYNEFAG